MKRLVAIVCVLCLSAAGFLFSQQRAADPSQRYFRLICLVHLTGSGKAGDPVVPEYVVQGTAAAQTGAAAPTTGTASVSGMAVAPAQPGQVAGQPAAPSTPAGVPMASRPGYLAWSMQVTDDGTMAIIHIVAADRHAFDSIMADTRPEIRVFEIGKDSATAIQTEMQKYKKDFDLTSFKVAAQ
jgi:hypothetical protein